ncbi:hypothetical protein EGJ06_05890 [Stenotrophomonas maltophilia]|nr:hypothetical protein EGJ06_05890 [Stenotrophomonas maltophilia]RRU13173.1 hypothetical protein EGJ77_05850 [Stenotrophomonas maltophilia]
MGPLAGVSAAWMPRPSPQGRVYGVPRQRTHPAFDSFPRSVGAGALRCSWLLVGVDLGRHDGSTPRVDDGERRK